MTWGDNRAMRLRLFATILASLASAEVKSRPTIAFTNVAVVDVERGSLRQNQTVVIEGARIVAVDAAAHVSLPRRAKILSGKGKFLIPGLWDMHLQESGNRFVPLLFLANGVTGIRDMYDQAPRIREVIQEHIYQAHAPLLLVLR